MSCLHEADSKKKKGITAMNNLNLSHFIGCNESDMSSLCEPDCPRLFNIDTGAVIKPIAAAVSKDTGKREVLKFIVKYGSFDVFIQEHSSMYDDIYDCFCKTHHGFSIKYSKHIPG